MNTTRLTPMRNLFTMEIVQANEYLECDVFATPFIEATVRLADDIGEEVSASA